MPIDAYCGYDPTISWGQWDFGCYSYVGSSMMFPCSFCWVGRLGDLAEGLEDRLCDLRCPFLFWRGKGRFLLQYWSWSVFFLQSRHISLYKRFDVLKYCQVFLEWRWMLLCCGVDSSQRLKGKLCRHGGHLMCRETNKREASISSNDPPCQHPHGFAKFASPYRSAKGWGCIPNPTVIRFGGPRITNCQFCKICLGLMLPSQWSIDKNFKVFPCQCHLSHYPSPLWQTLEMLAKVESLAIAVPSLDLESNESIKL